MPSDTTFGFGEPGAVRPRIFRLEIRGQTAPGAAVLTAGFVVAGNGPLRLLVRGVGPSLGAFGVSGTIADPRLTVFAGGWSSPLASDEGGAVRGDRGRGQYDYCVSDVSRGAGARDVIF